MIGPSITRPPDPLAHVKGGDDLSSSQSTCGGIGGEANMANGAASFEVIQMDEAMQEAEHGDLAASRTGNYPIC